MFYKRYGSLIPIHRRMMCWKIVVRLNLRGILGGYERLTANDVTKWTIINGNTIKSKLRAAVLHFKGALREYRSKI